MFQKRMRRALPILLGFAVLLFSNVPDAFTESKETVQNKVEDKSPTIAGAKAARDNDGAVRPLTDKEERELSAKIQKALKQYPRYQMKSGKDGKSLVVAPYNFRWSVATVGPDGKVQYNCADTTEKIDEIVNQSTTGAKAEKE